MTDTAVFGIIVPLTPLDSREALVCLPKAQYLTTDAPKI